MGSQSPQISGSRSPLTLTLTLILTLTVTLNLKVHLRSIQMMNVSIGEVEAAMMMRRSMGCGYSRLFRMR